MYLDSDRRSAKGCTLVKQFYKIFPRRRIASFALCLLEINPCSTLLLLLCVSLVISCIFMLEGKYFRDGGSGGTWGVGVGVRPPDFGRIESAAGQ